MTAFLRVLVGLLLSLIAGVVASPSASTGVALGETTYNDATYVYDAVPSLFSAHSEPYSLRRSRVMAVSAPIGNSVSISRVGVAANIEICEPDGEWVVDR